MGISRVELSRLLLYNCTTEQKNAMFFTRTSNGQRKRNSMGLGQKITKLPEGITERIHFNDISSLSQQPFVAEINHTLTLQAIEGVMRFFFQNHRLLPNTLYQSFWSFKSLRNSSDFIKAINASQKDKALPVKTSTPSFVTFSVYFRNSLLDQF